MHKSCARFIPIPVLPFTIILTVGDLPRIGGRLILHASIYLLAVLLESLAVQSYSVAASCRDFFLTKKNDAFVNYALYIGNTYTLTLSLIIMWH